MKLADLHVGADFFGRTVHAVHADTVELRCECGTISPVKLRHVSNYNERTAARRCRACGYANMKSRAREDGDRASQARRLQICRAIGAQIGPSCDSRTIQHDPVVVGALEWFEREQLGGMPFSAPEIGALMGLSRAGVGVIEARASEKLRRGLAKRFDVLEELRDRDAGRDPFAIARPA